MPERSCAACRRKADKAALARFVADAGGELAFDACQVMPGRGAYLCREEKCVRAALKSKALTRALKGKATGAWPWSVEALVSQMSQNNGR